MWIQRVPPAASWWAARSYYVVQLHVRRVLYPSVTYTHQRALEVRSRSQDAALAVDADAVGHR